MDFITAQLAAFRTHMSITMRVMRRVPQAAGHAAWDAGKRGRSLAAYLQLVISKGRAEGYKYRNRVLDQESRNFYMRLAATSPIRRRERSVYEHGVSSRA